MTEDTCGNCKYWKALQERTNGAPAQGFCRRYPPTAVPIQSVNAFTGESQIGAQNLLTPVLDSDWCGEHAASCGQETAEAIGHLPQHQPRA
jgi:hypothetical protein